jgi:hypothetical protein
LVRPNPYIDDSFYVKSIIDNCSKPIFNNCIAIIDNIEISIAIEKTIDITNNQFHNSVNRKRITKI